jgi:HEAT repeat protein
MENHDPLIDAYRAKDIEALRDAVGHVKKRSAAPLLTKLLLEDWHDSHEDIAFELGLIGDPCAIDSIAKAVTLPVAYLVEWGNLHEFQRKCTYALARIGTPESRKALEALTQHSDSHIRECAIEGLEKWPLPYQGNEYV